MTIETFQRTSKRLLRFARPAACPKWLWQLLRIVLLITGLCGFVGAVSGYVNGSDDRKLPIGTAVFALASYALLAINPIEEAADANKADCAEKQRNDQHIDWLNLIYCISIGFGFTLLCSFLFLSRKYGFLSAPVLGLTVSAMAIYGTIAIVVGYFTRRRMGVLVFVCLPCAIGALIMKLGLLR